jgi:hypothetical protein
MKPSVEQLVAQLKSGVALEEITASLVSPERRQLLQRSSAARIFDQGMFEQVLGPEPSQKVRPSRWRTSSRLATSKQSPTHPIPTAFRQQSGHAIYTNG